MYVLLESFPPWGAASMASEKWTTRALKPAHMRGAKPRRGRRCGPTWEWVLDGFWICFGLFLGLFKLNFDHFIVRNNLFWGNRSIFHRMPRVLAWRREKNCFCCEKEVVLYGLIEIDWIMYFIEFLTKVNSLSRSISVRFVSGFLTRSISILVVIDNCWSIIVEWFH